MALVRDPETGLMLRRCPHCGSLCMTLGSRCDACDRLFDEDERSVLDLLPLLDGDVFPGGYRFPAMLAVGLVNVMIVIVLGPPVTLYRALRRLRRHPR